MNFGFSIQINNITNGTLFFVKHSREERKQPTHFAVVNIEDWYMYLLHRYKSLKSNYFLQRMPRYLFYCYI